MKNTFAFMILAFGVMTAPVALAAACSGTNPQTGKDYGGVKTPGACVNGIETPIICADNTQVQSEGTCQLDSTNTHKEKKLINKRL